MFKVIEYFFFQLKLVIINKAEGRHEKKIFGQEKSQTNLWFSGHMSTEEISFFLPKQEANFADDIHGNLRKSTVKINQMFERF